MIIELAKLASEKNLKVAVSFMESYCEIELYTNEDEFIYSCGGVNVIDAFMNIYEFIKDPEGFKERFIANCDGEIETVEAIMEL